MGVIQTFVLGIADEIERGFMPLCFTCSCKGAHPECDEAMTATAYAQRDTVQRIVTLLRKAVKDA